MGIVQPSLTVIPAYIYPTVAGSIQNSPWGTIINSLRKHSELKWRSFVVLNANNGIIKAVPNSIPDWKMLAEETKEVTRNLCYVNLCHKTPPFDTCGDVDLQGARPSQEALRYVDDWIAAIGIDNIHGFFLDDTPMSGLNKRNIKAVIKGIKARNSNFTVITNPGVAAKDRKLMNMVTATVHQENLTPNSADGQSPPSVEDFPISGVAGKMYPPNKFVAMYRRVNSSSWESYADIAGSRGFGYYYATDGEYWNLPAYFDEMMGHIASNNA